MKGIRGKPKPYGGTRPVIMNAGASATGQVFAIRNCDAFFLQASRTSLEETAQKVRTAQGAAREQGREIGCYTVGVVTCKPTMKQAQDYFHHCIVERADWSAVDGILGLKNISPQTVPMQEYLIKRSQYAQGMGGLPIVGDPDHVASTTRHRRTRVPTGWHRLDTDISIAIVADASSFGEGQGSP